MYNFFLLPEATQEEDKPAGEEEAGEEQGERFWKWKTWLPGFLVFNFVLSADIL